MLSSKVNKGWATFSVLVVKSVYLSSVQNCWILGQFESS